MAITSLLQNFGAFLGVSAFSYITHYTGRKPAFAVSFVLAMASTAFTFWYLNDVSDIFWMIPIMGFCQIALFGGYAIYFPEFFLDAAAHGAPARRSATTSAASSPPSARSRWARSPAPSSAA